MRPTSRTKTDSKIKLRSSECQRFFIFINLCATIFYKSIKIFFQPEKKSDFYLYINLYSYILPQYKSVEKINCVLFVFY